MPFKKGQSGNPAGRPVGIVDRRAALRSALEGKADLILEKAVEKALEGNASILLALLARLLPNLRPEVPALESLGNFRTLTECAEEVAWSSLSGRVSPSSASELLHALLSVARVRESDELLTRLRTLETKLNENS